MGLLQQIIVPLLAVNDTALTVVEMHFKSGQQVKKGELLMVFETSKTTYEVLSEAHGYIQYLCETGQDYEVNTVVAKIFSEVSEVPVVQPAMQAVNHTISSHVPDVQPLQEISTWTGESLFSQEAMKLITASGLSREVFANRDFVSLTDVERHLGIIKPSTVPVQTHPVAATKSKTAVTTDPDKVIVEKLTSNKRREIEYLSEVQGAGLTSTIHVMVETEGIFTHINQSLAYFKNSLLPVIIYESARLLIKYPAMNAYYTSGGIAFYKEIHVGFAIDIDKGLKVLKVSGTADKTLGSIEKDILQLSEKYLDDRLEITDLLDITFTITDLSAEGVSSFRPLINMMNSAILGISAIDEKLQRCTLSLSFDHRVTEGKQAAQFLNDLKKRLESYQSRNYPKLNQGITCSKCRKTLGEDLGETGFVKCITPDGVEGYLCQSCLKGF